tara:strand:- start:248 stop:589 length:342 start_codon:yes stop_codon:yes gene_type:complete
MGEEGQLQDYSVDQAAGAIVLVLGAVASLLLVIWQSKCHCKMNLCYLFQCERRPPSEEEMKGLKDQSEKLKAKAKKSKGDSPKKKKKPDEEEGFASAEETEPEPEILVPPPIP